MGTVVRPFASIFAVVVAMLAAAPLQAAGVSAAPASPPLLDAACSGGDASACFRLARQYDDSTDQRHDAERATHYYDLACQHHSADGCIELARRYLTGEGVAQDEQRALRLFRVECDAGHMPACAKVGLILAEGRAGLPRDERAAVALFRRGCTARDADSCASLAFMTRAGRGGVAKDLVEAGRLVELACRITPGRACFEAGSYYDHDAQPPSPTRAADLYVTACNHSVSEGCHNLALHYLLGRGVPRDLAKSRHLFLRACGLGDDDACAQADNLRTAAPLQAKIEGAGAAALAQRCSPTDREACYLAAIGLIDGIGVHQDLPRAVDLLKRTCYGGQYARSCGLLGTLEIQGLGVAKNERLAFDLFSTACELGEPDSCANVGIMLATAQGVERDNKRALAVVRAACAKDVASACRVEGLILGEGLVEDLSPSVKALDKGCRLGDALACRELGRAPLP